MKLHFFSGITPCVLLVVIELANSYEGRFPLEPKECTDRVDIPVIKLKSYTTVVPLEDSNNNVIFSQFSMARRLLRKERRPVKNETVDPMDVCLGEGGEREWTLPTSNRTSFISEVVIECFDQGIGPVEFEYQGLGDFGVANHEDNQILGSGLNTSKYQVSMPASHKIVFTNFTDQITGTYSCRSVDYPEKSNSFHLYAPSANGGRPYLVQRGKTINVTAEQGSSVLTLPCIANNPKAKIFLFKKFIIFRMGIVVVKYQHQPFHIYDPKIGFQIDISDRGVDPYGTYVCSSSADIRDPTDRIRINLMPPNGVSRKSDQSMTFLDFGHQLVRNSYKRLHDLVNSFFI
ncbi:hypothetical protein Ocin01_08510 [Orchesella cincta]|uniref:Uncharacterized protein n=1 Tax=Orchesella cincta TaxID=48709 RepID=A0A1D2MZE2_ORCCI|nr:hypothetical protein Ocin01_08510 [Orchesella cincta]